jgi:hypothetical protein
MRIRELFIVRSAAARPRQQYIKTVNLKKKPEHTQRHAPAKTAGVTVRLYEE